MLVVSLLAILFSTTTPKAFAYERHGAQIDRVRLLTVGDAPWFNALKQGEIDFAPDIFYPQEIESLISEGYLVTSTLGFHIWYMGINLRRPYLEDVSLRHALFHAYNQEEIVASIYKYTVTPVQSIIPPSQGEWANPAVPKHPFNPGNIGDLYPAQHSTFGIMAAAGYTYVGAGYGDLTAHWEKNGDPLPSWKLWTPMLGYYYSPTYFHGELVCDEWHKCGFNNIIHQPADIMTLYDRVWNYHDFDMYFEGWSLGSFPQQLYELCLPGPCGSGNPCGIKDENIWDLIETMRFSLDHEAAVAAAWEAQERLYDPQYWQALPFMALYSRVYYEGAARSLDGVVNSPGYGSDNTWTWMNWRWNTPDGLRPGTGDSLVIYGNGGEPQTLNPLAATSVYESNIYSPIFDPGIQVDPYTHADVVWQYSEYPTVAGPITEVTPNGVYIFDGMSVEYTLRDDIYWQDGNKFDADDAIFSLNFLKNNQIPRYISTWRYIADICKMNELTFKVWANHTTSRDFIHDWDKGAFLCPPQVWSWLDGQPLATILAYDPSTNTTDTGPWSYPLTPNGPKTQLFGTGPFVFDLYDPVGMYADLHNWDANGINKGYFKTTSEIADLLTELFHSCGDVDRDGWIWAGDKHDYGLSFGKTAGDTGYNPNADLNSDSLVDWEDGAIICASWSKKKEYTKP